MAMLKIRQPGEHRNREVSPVKRGRLKCDVNSALLVATCRKSIDASYQRIPQSSVPMIEIEGRRLHNLGGTDLSEGRDIVLVGILADEQHGGHQIRSI